MPLPKAKVDGEQAADIDAERLGHAPVVDGGADLGAHPRPLERRARGRLTIRIPTAMRKTL